MIKTEPEGKCSPSSIADGSAVLPDSKITFSLGGLNENGLVGDAGAKRALAYEFCIPAADRYREEVKGIDPTASFAAAAPGRINCGPHEYLCTGSTHQADFVHVLESLAKLPYVQRIDAAEFE